MSKRPRTLLISTPFMTHEMPPVGIGSIKSSAAARGYHVDSVHLPLYLADQIGVGCYESFSKHLWLCEMLYAMCAFPQHAKAKHLDIYYNDLIKDYYYRSNIPKELWNAQAMYEVLDDFNRWVVEEIFCTYYDIVGFSLITNQLVSSIYLARLYKQLHPTTKILFGGPLCTGDIGRSYLEAFPWVDAVVHGEGEETFIDYIHMVQNSKNHPIKGCSFRNGEEIICGEERLYISDLDALLVPDYSDYFADRALCKRISSRIQLPIEFSRGCWWKKCAFCSFDSVFRGYRRHSPQYIRKTMESLADHYQNLHFFCVDLIEYKPAKKLVEALSGSKRQFSFFLDVRETISYSDLNELRGVGLCGCLMGTESLSTTLLKKMRKGTTTIKNILGLINAKSLGVEAVVNLIVGYPGETKREFNQTLRNIKRCWHLLRDFGESPFTLQYYSPMFMDPSQHGLENVRPDYRYRLLIPDPYYSKMLFYSWNYSTHRPVQGSYRLALTETGWKGSDAPYLVSYDGINFMKIRDGRYENREVEYTLDRDERDVYTYCETPKEFAETARHFKKINRKRLQKILKKLCRDKLIIYEDDHYLSLAIPHRSRRCS